MSPKRFAMRTASTLFLRYISLIQADSLSYLPNFSSCTFPSPVLTPTQFRIYCITFSRLSFLCDLHRQINNDGIVIISQSYLKNQAVLTINSTSSIGIIIVRQLAQPVNVDAIYQSDLEYGCLFNDACSKMDRETVRKFSTSPKTFVKMYASIVYNRWFQKRTECEQPNVLALIVADGLVNDARKLPHIALHTSEPRLVTTLSNIQIESMNGILQGWPLHAVVADLIDQIGNALREFHALQGGVRLHLVPVWAINVFLLCGVLTVGALVAEWYIVRRKFTVRRTNSVMQMQSGKSKTHMIFS